MSRISRAFSDAAGDGRLVIAPYVALGYPDMPTSVKLARAYLDAGADMLELGVPFSDPIADGPTIQRATQRALAKGATLARCIEAAADIRAATGAPLVLMGYANPFMQWGYEDLARDLQGAGVDGLIVPDLLPDDNEDLAQACAAHDLDVISLLAPTTPSERIRRVAERGSGFLYCVSLTGVTGRREDLQSGLTAFLQRVGESSSLPRAVGFGISTPAHVRALCGQADAAIMASALIDIFDAAPPAAAVSRAAAQVGAMVDAARCR
ncbi:MAG: tryptophan synthase subunit alpha [Chloroflexi bacterium]|nr:tryptophan synthase subunit alpha [Chloroflexota bacterium]